MQSASTNITTFPGKVGISNANPTHTLAIGSNVYVDDTGSNKLTVTGVISGDGLGISNIQTANVLGLTDNVMRITTLETDLDNNSSRVTTVSADLADNSSRISTVSSDLSDNSSRISTVSSDLADNSSRITTVSSDLSDNSSRIDSLGDGAHTFTGVKTFEDDIILESNLRVNGSLTYANTVNMIVSDPIMELGANNQHTNDLGLVLTRHGNLGNDSNVAIFYDESQDNLKIGYTDNSASETTLTTTATGLDVSITGNVAAAYDTDETSYFGRAAVGYMGQSDQASFSHLDKNTSANFALKQAASGATHINTPTGQHIRFSVNASEVGRFTGGGDFKVGANKLYVDTSASEVQMYSQATGSTAGPDLVLMRNNPNNGSNNEYIGQIRYEGLSDTGNSRLYAKTTGKIKTATNGSEDGVIETMIKTGGSNRISVRHSGAKFLIQKGTDLQVGEVANLYVDTSTSRVGVGMSNPSYTLDVDGDINLSGDFYQGGSPFVSSLWTSSGTDLYYSSGSVGISNTAPDHDLSVGSNLYVHDTGSNVLVVDGNVNVSNTLTAHRLTLNNVSIITTMDLAQVSNVGNVTSNVLQFTNPATAFVTTGNVGIGTTSPDTTLEVSGNIKRSGATYTKAYTYISVTANDDLYIGRFSINAPPAKIDIRDSGTALGSGSRFSLARHYDRIPRVQGFENSFYTTYKFYYQAVDHTTYDVWFRPNRNGNYVINVDSMGFTDTTEPSSPTLTECGYDLFTADGNVGIGTTGPIAALDIDGGANDDTTPALAIRGGLYDTSDLYVLNSYNVNTGVGYAAKVIGVNIKNKVETDNTIQIRNNVGGLTSAGAIYFGSDEINQGIFGVLGGIGATGTTLTEHLTVKSNGNVGIGTPSPGARLDVQFTGDDGIRAKNSGTSHASVYIDSASGYSYLRFQGSGANKFWLQSNPSGDLAFRPSGGGHVMDVKNNGNVGIGSSSPSQKLDVNGVIKGKNPTWSVYKGSTGGNNSGILQYNNAKCTAVNVTMNTVVVGNQTYYYRATITVAGRYFVGFQAFGNPNQSGVGAQIAVYKNGNITVRNYCTVPNSNYFAIGGLGVILDLVVNDYVEIYSSATLHHNANCSFYGFMIG